MANVTINPPLTPIAGNLKLAPEWWRFFYSLNQGVNEAGAGSVTTAPGSGLAGGGTVAEGISLSIAANGVSDAMLRQSLPTSVVGRAFGSAGNVADIQAVTDNVVFGRWGGQLMFRPASSIPATVGDGNYGDITVSGSGSVWTINTVNANVGTFGSATSIPVITVNAKGQITAVTTAFDATLTALAAYNTNGLLTQTAADTFTGRTLTGTANEVAVANGSGVAGNPTISLPSALTFTGKTVTGGTFSGATLSGITTLPNSGQITSGGNLGIGSAPATTFSAMDAAIGNVRFEVSLGASTLTLQAFNRVSATYQTFNIDGTTIQLRPSGAVMATINGTGLDVAGLSRCDAFRIDQTPTAETPAATHTITISANGTNYKLLCVAA